MHTESRAPAEVRNKPLVSVIIVTHNRKEDVKEALQSVCDQTYRRLEIVLVDSGSTDGTCDLVRRRFKQVRTIQLTSNVGPCAGRNIGAENSHGDILFFLDDDVSLERDALQVIVLRFAGEPGLGVIVCSIFNFSSHQPEWRYAGHMARLHDTEFYLGDVLHEMATAIRRRAFHRAGGWPSDLFQYGEGRDMSYRMLDQGFRMIYLPRAKAYHKRSPFVGVSRKQIAQRRCFLITRNDLWIAWSYLPAPRAILETCAKLVYYSLYSLKEGTFPSYARGVLAACGRLPRILSQRRRPVRRETLSQRDYLLHFRIVQDPRQLSLIPSSTWASLLMRKLRYLVSLWVTHP